MECVATSLFKFRELTIKKLTASLNRQRPDSSSVWSPRSRVFGPVQPRWSIPVPSTGVSLCSRDTLRSPAGPCFRGNPRRHPPGDASDSRARHGPGCGVGRDCRGAECGVGQPGVAHDVAVGGRPDRHGGAVWLASAAHSTRGAIETGLEVKPPGAKPSPETAFDSSHSENPGIFAHS